MAREDPEPEFDLPPGETPVARCPHCERPFRSERARDLHVGEAHAADCSASEADAHEAAREAERDDLFYFHLRVVFALGLLYAGTVVLYMVALGSGLL